LGSVQPGAIKNKVDMNIYIQEFMWTYLSSSFFFFLSLPPSLLPFSLSLSRKSE
jgi:hypothetical protein